MAPHEKVMPGDEVLDAERITDSFRESSTLVLSEEQALAKARSSLNEALPIFVTYAFDDQDNPRNWPKWRKWYITCLVSMLNVFTYINPHSFPRRGRSLANRSDAELLGAQGGFLPGHLGSKRILSLGGQ